MKRTLVVSFGLMLGAALVAIVPGAAQQMSDIKKTDKNTKKAAKAKKSGKAKSSAKNTDK